MVLYACLIGLRLIGCCLRLDRQLVATEILAVLLGLVFATFGSCAPCGSCAPEDGCAPLQLLHAVSASLLAW